MSTIRGNPLRHVGKTGPRGIAFLVALAVLVITLAVLQYRMVTELGDAYRTRLQIRLDEGAQLIRRSFANDVLAVAMSFRGGMFGRSPDTVDSITGQLREWDLNRNGPRILESVWVATQRDNGDLSFLQYDARTRALVPATLIPQIKATALACAVDPAWNSGSRALPPPFNWRFAVSEKNLMLLRLLSNDGLVPQNPKQERVVLLVLQLDLQQLQEDLLPELVTRAFGEGSQADFSIAITTGGPDPDTIFATAEDATGVEFADPDIRISMFGDPGEGNPQANRLWDRIRPRLPAVPESSGEQSSEQRSGEFVPGRTNRGGSDPRGPQRPGMSRFGPGRLFGPNQPSGPGRYSNPFACDAHSELFLSVKHTSGSLADAVNRLKYRNLALSGGVLALLTLSIAFTLIATQRAHRLARQQMEFAAGVSHELRTPLAVIRSAAENLADGIVSGPEQTKRYGNLIRREERRLSIQVEQTLQFAAGKSSGHSLSLKPIHPEAAIENAISTCAPVLSDAGMQIDPRLDDPLPVVLADADALSRCIQNLITNAVKYGKDGGWIGVRAQKEFWKGKEWVRVSVSDRGPGVAPEDRAYIFDPFYQSPLRDSSKPGGVGLGLSLTRDLMESMGGFVQLDSEPGPGARFSLFVPKAPSYV